MSSFNSYIFLNPLHSKNRGLFSNGSSDADYNRSLSLDIVTRFDGIAFYCGNDYASDNCCFNHIVGLPEKHGRQHPLYDYEMNLFNKLEVEGKKYLWVLKATGLGISEFFLRYIVWLALAKNSRFKNTNICFITGPREELTITLVNRVKTILASLGIFSDTKNTVAEFAGVHIEAFPSNSLHSMRGLTQVSFILIDEADFFDGSQQERARAIAERYIAKSDPYIIMVSTPNQPGGLFERMQYDKSPDFLYDRSILPYTVGLDKIYTRQEIEIQKRSPDFEREYNCKYGYNEGNAFLSDKIDACIVDENDAFAHVEYLRSQSIGTTVSIGMDPGMGSSKFAICALTELDGKLHVLESNEYERPDPSYMTDICFDMINKYQAEKVYVDGNNPGVIRALKININEETDYLRIKAECRRDKVLPGERMRIVPVDFGSDDGRDMLTHLMSLVSDNLIVIRREFNELIQQMRIATISRTTGKLDKKGAQSTMDSLDACMLAASLWKFR